MTAILHTNQPPAPVPLMTREAFASAVGLPLGVLVAQCERGYWPQVTIGKRVLINVEALRMHAVEKGREFAL
jgi:hypothetical protein